MADFDLAVKDDVPVSNEAGTVTAMAGNGIPAIGVTNEDGKGVELDAQVVGSSPNGRRLVLDVEGGAVDELELIHQSSKRHHSVDRPTYGRVHLVEEMEAIDEVERALELDELRSSIAGHSPNRRQSLHRVKFDLTRSQEDKSMPNDDDKAQVELDTILSDAKGANGGAGDMIGDEEVAITDSNAKPDISGAIFNLMNYAIGAGILALPYAFRQAGVVLGAFLVLLVGAATIFSMYLLLGASSAAKAYGYEQLARVGYGDTFAQAVKVIIIVDSFGALSAYMIVIGETVTKVVKYYVGSDTIWANQLFVLSLVSFFVMLPLCCLKNINYLGFTSALSLVPLVYLAVLQIYYFVAAGGIQPGVALFNWDVLYALPVIIFSYSSQQALFPLYTELKERNGTERHIKQVVLWSIGLTAASYLFSGFVGVFTYPTDAKGSILNNFPGGIAVDVLLVTTAASLILSFPVILWPARVSTDRLLFLDRPFSYLRFVIEAAVLLTIAFLIAVAIPSFSTVLGLFGSLTNTTIGYLLPPLYFLKLVPESWKTSRTKQLAIALFVIGGTAGLFSAGIITHDYIISKIHGTNAQGE